jgi:hypothetical protein
MRPTAPATLTAYWSKPDSTAMTASSKNGEIASRLAAAMTARPIFRGLAKAYMELLVQERRDVLGG